MSTSLFWRVAHPIVASALLQDDTLNTITSGLLDVLVVAFLLLAVVAFFSYTRSRQGTQARGSASRGSGRSLGIIASVMMVIPVVWLLLVWGGTSFVQSFPVPGTPTPSPKPVPTNPKPHPTPAVTLASDLVIPGKLTVGSVINNPPQEYISGGNKTIGFDIDLIGAIAQKMKLQVQIVPVQNFQSLFDGLNSRQFDVAISAVSKAPDLAGHFDFVLYLKTSESLLVPTGNSKGIKGLADLCGLSVGVQDGSTELTDLLLVTCPTGKMITPITKTTEADVVQLLLQGTVDAAYLDTPAANYYIGQNQRKFDIVATPSNALDEGIVIRKGDTPMLNAVQAVFASLKQDGTYGQLINKWGLTQEGLAITDQRPLGPSTAWVNLEFQEVVPVHGG